MNVRNCRGCGRLFNYVTGVPLCQVCREKMEEKFQVVKEYIRQNPGVGIQQVSEACDVDPQQIRQWLKDDRLEVTENSPIFLNCESCGAPIRSGKYCDKCKNGLARDLNNAFGLNKKPEPKGPVKPDKTNPKMRFLK